VHSGEDSPYIAARLKANATVRGAPGWSKGKMLAPEHIAKIALAGTGRKLSDATKTKIGVTAKINGISGGYREGGGKGKKGKFQGIHCDSSWELAFLICTIEKNQKVERITSPRFYVFEGKTRKYFPDFLVDGTVIEIKGWKTPQWEAKHQQNPDVIVLGFAEIAPMIERAKQIYGDDFTVAYE
jgi:hypothetical protein